MYHNVMGGFSVQLKVPEPKQKPDAVPQLPVITMHLQGYSRWRQEDSWKSRSWGTQPLLLLLFCVQSLDEQFYSVFVHHNELPHRGFKSYWVNQPQTETSRIVSPN